MPYAAPASRLGPPASLVAAYPTPPPSPLSDICGLQDDPFAQQPPSADPYLAAAAPGLPPHVRRPPLRPSLSADHLSASFRLSRPRGILAVLGGVRVLNINATSVLDRMPYASVSRMSADTDVVDTILGTERRTSATLHAADLTSPQRRAVEITAEAVRIDSGLLSLRRAQSESTVEQAATSKTVVPTVALPGAPAETSPGRIHVRPPTPTRAADKPAATPRGASRSPSTPTSPAHVPIPAPGTGPSPKPSPSRAPARLSSRPARPTSSPSMVPNVLPEVRSPRRNAEAIQTRRSRRPRLFGFTGLVDESPTTSSAASSARNSPEAPLSPAAEAPAPMFPRRNPVRARSETSLSSLPSLITSPPSRSAAAAAAGGAGAGAPSPSHTNPRLHNTGLKLDLGGIVPPRPADLLLNSGVVNSPYHSVIKKKSGEIVKSALKPYGGPPTDDGERPSYAGSRSCPTTPSCPKYVHFDTQLERIKLFLQDQKPQVVSLQGSPTEDLSETEDDTPDEILTVRLPNFPTSHDYDADLFLESLFLNDDRDALRGVVRVKNLAFHKSVVVRFTFDWWQTVSEVSATYKESIRGGAFDRFQFTLNLHDLLDRITEKTLFLCMRYNTDGREFWDSNGGENYRVIFEEKKPERPKYMPKRSVTRPEGSGRSVNRNGVPWSVTGADADRMADLRAKLNRLTAEDRELNRPLSPVKRSYGSPRPKAVKLPSTDGISSLAGRYDFGSSLKSARNTSPQGAKRELEFYSPRPGHFQLPLLPSPLSPSPLSPNPLSPATTTNTLIPGGPPSPLPPALVTSSNNNSSSTSLDSVTDTPADSPSIPLHRELDDSGTPSDTSDSLISSASSTASGSPMSPTSVFPWSTNGKDRSSDDMSLASYSSFIEQFCWAGDKVVDDERTGVRRVHSTSSLDEHLTHTHRHHHHHSLSSPPDVLTPRAYTPTQGFSSYGLPLSGSSTGASTTPNTVRRASPPTREDLEHVDNAIRSLSNSLSNTPVSGSPCATPPLTRIPSGAGPVLAN